jgi:hypothetical protein
MPLPERSCQGGQVGEELPPLSPPLLQQMGAVPRLLQQARAPPMQQLGSVPPLRLSTKSGASAAALPLLRLSPLSSGLDVRPPPFYAP